MKMAIMRQKKVMVANINSVFSSISTKPLTVMSLVRSDTFQTICAGAYWVVRYVPWSE